MPGEAPQRTDVPSRSNANINPSLWSGFSPTSNNKELSTLLTMVSLTDSYERVALEAYIIQEVVSVVELVTPASE